MRRAVVLILVVSSIALAQVMHLTNEVLVLTTPTRVDSVSFHDAIEVQNLGPNPIYCSMQVAADAVVGKARRLDTFESWSPPISENTTIWCVTSVAQVTGGGTITSEMRN
jgi:hypothetical protein